MLARRLRRIQADTGQSPLPIYPAQLLNLTNWKITLPINNSNQLGNQNAPAKEVTQTALNTFKHDSYFYNVRTSNGDGVTFIAPCNGAPTSNSGYPRSELREMTSNGTAQANWGLNDGTIHTMIVTQSVDALPIVKPQTAAGQIHNAGDDLVEILADGQSPTSGSTWATGPMSSIPFKLTYRRDGSSSGRPALIPDYVMGELFTVKIEVQNNTLRIYCNRGTTATTLIETTPNLTSIANFSSNASSGMYYKAGDYTQSNVDDAGDNPNAYGQVTIYALSVTHV